MKNKIQYFENLRVIAVLGVIVTHAIILLWDISKHKIGPVWWGANILQSSIRFIVPILFMQSGALLLSADKNSQVYSFLKTRFSKVLIPFIVWTLLYCVYVTYSAHIPFSKNLVRAIQGPVYYHLWYMYILIGLYLITPIFQIYTSHAPRRNIFYFLILWFVITGIIPSILKATGISINLSIAYLSGYIGYFILGYYLQKYPISKIATRIAPLVAIVSIILNVLLTYYVTVHGHHPKGENDYFFHGNTSIFVITFSWAVFVMAKHSKFLNSFQIPYSNILNFGKICFGVYLLQSLIIDILQNKFKIAGTVENPIFGTLEVIALTTLICFGFFITLDILSQKSQQVKKMSILIY